METTLKKQGELNMNQNSKIKKLVYSAIAAALYVVLTVAIAPLSYQAVQFRFSELLVFLAWIDPWYIPGLTLGCFIANLFGPFGIADAVGGSLATLFAVSMMAVSAKGIKKPLLSLAVASLWPAVSALIIAFEIVFFTGAEESYWYWTAMIAIGQFGVVSVCGVPLMYRIVKKHKKLIQILTIKE